jgi:predicted HicB family RNase H-like nuclease
MNGNMTPDEEYEFYAKSENQEPQEPACRRSARQLTKIVPVRFSPKLLAKIENRAGSDNRSLSVWVRRAVEHELKQTASPR